MQKTSLLQNRTVYDVRFRYFFPLFLFLYRFLVAASTTTKEGKQAHLEDLICQAKFFRDIGCAEFDKLSNDMEAYVNKET